MEYDLNRFGAKFKNYIGDVAGRDIDQWLRDLDVSGRTRNNMRMSVQTLFSFAKAKRYLPKDHDEMDAVALAKEVAGGSRFSRRPRCGSCWRRRAPELVPFLAIGAFAGVRHAEIQRLDWKDIRFDAGIIEIRAGKAKTASRRTVPIMPNLKTWLKRHQAGERAGLPVRQPDGPDRRFDRLRSTKRRSKKDVEGEFKWQHNGLRHSFISYRVAVVKNVAQVALEAGNSPAMIFSNYRELVTPQDAKAWFAIVPARGKGQGQAGEDCGVSGRGVPSIGPWREWCGGCRRGGRDAVGENVLVQLHALGGLVQGLDIVVRDDELGALEMLQVKINVLFPHGEGQVLAAAGPAMPLTPVADAANVEISHPRLAIVARGEGGQESVELGKKDGVIEHRFPRSFRPGGLPHLVIASLRAGFHHPARGGELLLNPVRAGFLATDAERDPQPVPGPLLDQRSMTAQSNWPSFGSRYAHASRM